VNVVHIDEEEEIIRRQVVDFPEAI